MLINHGGTEMGQGLHTKMLQVAATTLGVPLEQVRLAPTRTDKVPNTSATAASSGADLNGGAVKNACEQIHGAAATAGRGAGPRASPLGRTLVREAYFSRVQLWAAGFYRTEGLHWDSTAMHGPPVQVLRVRRRRDRGRGRRLHRRLPHPPGRHRARRRRQPLAAGRPRPDRGRLRAGRRLADPRGPALGRVRRPEPRPAARPRRPAPTSCRASARCPRSFNVALLAAGARGRRRLRLQGRRRAAADAGLLGARGAARRRRPRSARPAPASTSPSPATPEAVYWAIEQARRGRRARPRRRGPARRRTRPARRRTPQPLHPRSEQVGHAAEVP